MVTIRLYEDFEDTYAKAKFTTTDEKRKNGSLEIEMSIEQAEVLAKWLNQWLYNIKVTSKPCVPRLNPTPLTGARG